MPPEIIDPERRQSAIREKEMQKADIWSLGMLLFCLCNPDCKGPFFKEAVSQVKRGQDFQEFVKSRISLGVMPESSGMYEELEATVWQHVYKAFLACIKMSPEDRPSLKKIMSIIDESDKSLNFPFRLHQGTALENKFSEDTFVHLVISN